MKNADMPAMPLSGDAYTDFAGFEVGKSSYNPQCQGLTKREMFAMYAMNTILGNYNPYNDGSFDSSNWQETAKNCVGLADSLLAELDK